MRRRTWSPDGKQLVASRGRTASEVVSDSPKIRKPGALRIAWSLSRSTKQPLSSAASATAA